MHEFVRFVQWLIASEVQDYFAPRPARPALQRTQTARDEAGSVTADLLRVPFLITFYQC